MVLINGVKYACDRCIRGHRVTTCTHTDQPLTMIKPKGRPASQCQHCREQRKSKSLHVTCTCGKKGKSPGMHLASCLCHKNSVCTCSSNASKKGDISKKKLTKSLSELNTVNLNAHNRLHNEETPQNTPPPTATKDPNFVIEDVVMPFDTGNGLLDLFSPVVNKYGNNTNDDSSSSSMSPADKSNLSGTDQKETDHSDNNIFPLFPLVGIHSFDTSNSKPLSSIPDRRKSNSGNNFNFSDRDSSRANHASKNLYDPVQSNRSNSTPQDSAKVSAYFQPIRPKRPDSVVSMASSSSSTNLSRSFDNSRPNGSTMIANLPAANYHLENKINQDNKPKELNQASDIFDSSNVLMNHHQSQLNEYNQALKNIGEQKQTNNGQAESSKNVDSYGLYPDGPGTPSQEQFNVQGTADLDFPMFNDFVSPSSFDTKSDIQF